VWDGPQGASLAWRELCNDPQELMPTNTYQPVTDRILETPDRGTVP